MSFKKSFEVLSGVNILRGMVHFNNDIAQCEPVIMVHGYFSANRNGPHRLFIEIANKLAELGYAVYRFDLSGMGESDGDITTIKFSHHVQDLKKIIKYIYQIHNDKHINIIAHSLGCNIALEFARYNSDILDRVVFLAPFISNNISMNQTFGDEKSIDDLMKNSFTYRRGLYSDYSYFEESDAEAFISDIKASDLQFNIIIAEKDQLIPLNLFKAVFRQTKNTEITYIANADHNFLECQKAVILNICKIFHNNIV